MTHLVAAALAYAARRLPVFPCLPRGKTPAIARGFHAATTNPETIRRYWRLRRSQHWDPDRIGVGVLGARYRRRCRCGEPARARSHAWPVAANAPGADRRRRSASLVPVHRTDPIDSRPDRARNRYTRRWRLMSSRRRACIRTGAPTRGAQIARATGRCAGMAGAARAQIRRRRPSPNARSPPLNTAEFGGHGCLRPGRAR